MKDKQILFIGPEFHHYHISIKKELEKKGAAVDFIPTYKESLFQRLVGKINKNQRKNYYQKKISLIEMKQYDYVLLIRGEDIPTELIKAVNKQAKFSVMYQWDSIKNCNYLHLLPYFNKTYTFDRSDATQYSNIEYFQLFHEVSQSTPITHNSNVKIDLLTIAGYTSWRYQEVNTFYQLAKKEHLNAVLKLYIPVKTLLKLWLTGKKVNLNILTLRPIDKKRYFSLLNSANTILDIPSPIQTGLSIRTIESLALSKKIITTNKNIIQESFYSKNHIYLLDKDSDMPDAVRFIKSNPSSTLSLSNLELGNWLDYIFQKK